MPQTPDIFDPYHKWLGISPEEQPASHYRLLGIREFEDDADVIDHGADRCMAHVRTFQNGKRSQWSQNLLNELAAARLCLLNPEQKKDYDTSLLQRQRHDEPPAQQTPPECPEPPPKQNSPAVTPSIGKSHFARGRTSARRRKQQQNARVASLVTLLAILATVAAIAIQIFGGHGG